MAAGTGATDLAGPALVAIVDLADAVLADVVLAGALKAREVVVFALATLVLATTDAAAGTLALDAGLLFVLLVEEATLLDVAACVT